MCSFKSLLHYLSCIFYTSTMIHIKYNLSKMRLLFSYHDLLCLLDILLGCLLANFIKFCFIICGKVIRVFFISIFLFFQQIKPINSLKPLMIKYFLNILWSHFIILLQQLFLNNLKNINIF